MKQFIKITVAFLLPMAFILQCGFSRGYYTTRDGTRMNGYVKFRTCAEEQGPGLQFKASMPGPAQAVPFRDISRIGTDGKTFLVIERGKITGIGNGGTGAILAELLLDGRVRLFRYCTTVYQSTMFRTRRYDVEQFIAGKENEGRYYLLPLEPAEFIGFAGEHFSDCPEVLRSIRNAPYTHPIRDPLPGRVSEYRMVESDQLITFIRAYNSCAPSR